MKCDEVQLMLPDFVINKLTNGNLGEVERHVFSCPTCKKAASELQDLMLGLPNIKQAVPSDTYFATILPRVHQRIEEKKKKAFQIPEYWLKFVMPVAMVLVVATAIFNFNRIHTQSVDAGVTAVTTEVSSDELNLILGQQELSEHDKITATDKEIIIELLAEESAPLSVTEDDAKSLLMAFNDEDVNRFYSLLEQ